ncbi:MAG: dihydropteroate synthase [Bacteroidales bacterium]
MHVSAKYINLNGTLHDLAKPAVMGIVNITPDSFFADSRYETEKAIVERTEQILAEGGLLIDVGAYSSRPDAVNITPEEEWKRLRFALSAIKKTAPNAAISVDTFRAEIARKAYDEFGIAMINDISGGELDPKMFETVGKLRIPYVMMHMRGTPQTMQQHCEYSNLIQEVIFYFSKKIEALRRFGACDIILDPGFGFSKTVDQNYELLHNLPALGVLDLPILAGVSRKSMIYKTLDCKPEESLNGTTVLNTLAIVKGANILRVHDVKEAVETVKLVTKTEKIC